MDKALVVFQDKKIRRAWFNDKWWFVVEDIIFVLTDSSDPKQYINKMRQRDEQLSKGWVQIVHTLDVDTAGGKQKMNCVNTEGALRIIQSVPSQKAEPFKQWLAKVGYERVEKIQDPELAQKRMKELYHIYRGDLKIGPINKLLPTLCYFFVQEPRAALYEAFGIKL